MTARCNTALLYECLDARRLARDLSWREVARETGLSPSSFSRLTHGDAPTAHSLAAMLVWLDVAPWWVTTGPIPPEPIP